MISNHEDEFVAVRVQDPRIQHEGSWNSYVDYKIFLHTNSKAFTAKTSCVRRRYSEFEWLKKKLQKNSGLVPVPDLPGKSFFAFHNEDFLERRRQGLQVFLDKVVHMTVCLSDSQLHLFLQTQLPVGHIQDCVQGHTPYTVTDAILTYASSNRGLAQALEDDPVKESSLTVSYESMESPAPHQPGPQAQDPLNPEPSSCADSDPIKALMERRGKEAAEQTTVTLVQQNHHLRAVIEDCGPAQVSFFVGDDQESRSPSEQSQPSSCQIRTPVEVHSSVGAGSGDAGVPEGEETPPTPEETAAPHLDVSEGAGPLGNSEEAKAEEVGCDFPEKCANPSGIHVQSLELHTRTGPEAAAASEKQVLENHVFTEVKSAESVARPDEPEGPEGPAGNGSPDQERTDKAESDESGISEENPDVCSDPEGGDGGAAQQADQSRVDKRAGLVSDEEDGDEDSQSLRSSNESIAKVSDEESVCYENEEFIQAANGYMRTSPEDEEEEDEEEDVVTCWSEAEESSRGILGLQANGRPEEKHLRFTPDGTDLASSLDLTLSGGDLTENSDFSVLESSSVPESAGSKYADQDTASSLSLDTSEEAREVEAH